MVTQSTTWDRADAAMRLREEHVRMQAEAEERLRQFEYRHGFSSDKLEEYLSKGILQETPEIGSWLFVLHTYHLLHGE
jgi:hypothetical protein